MSIDIQIVIIFGLYTIFPVAVLLATLPFFAWTRELKLIYAVSNIISLIFFLVYVTFLYKQSTPVICDIVDAIFGAIHSPQYVYLGIIGLVCFIIFVFFFYFILSLISWFFAKIIGLPGKFIRFLRKR